MNTAEQKPETFEGPDCFSDAALWAMNSQNGIGILQIDNLQSRLVEHSLLNRVITDREVPLTDEDEVAKTVVEIIDGLAGDLSDNAKQAIIDLHLTPYEFPFEIQKDMIGINNQFVGRQAQPAHIDSMDKPNPGNPSWLPSNLHIGLTLSLQLFGEAEWFVWNGESHQLKPRYRLDGHEVIDRSTGKLQLQPDLTFTHNKDQLVVMRQPETIHRTRAFARGEKSRKPVLVDIGLLIEPTDFMQKELDQLNEWATERRRQILAEMIVGYAGAELIPANTTE